MTRRSGPDRLERELEALAAHRADPTSEAAVAAIRKALRAGSSLAAAAAAELVADETAGALAGELAPAFRRFVEDGAKRDPGCRAKVAIVEALCRLGRDEGDVFLAAVRCRQPEKAWGPPVDTAAALRGHGAMGLASMQHPEAAAEIARLLADPEWVSRANAARAASCLATDVAVPLLRHKAHVGDAEPQVLGECFRALLALEPGRSFDFVAEWLDEEGDAAEQAALALGDSRDERAFPRLCAWFEAGAGGHERVRAARDRAHARRPVARVPPRRRRDGGARDGDPRGRGAGDLQARRACARRRSRRGEITRRPRAHGEDPRAVRRTLSEQAATTVAPAPWSTVHTVADRPRRGPAPPLGARPFLPLQVGGSPIARAARPMRRQTLSACLLASALASAPLAAQAAFTYGPILGRGPTPDSMVVRWGTAASAPTELRYRRAGESAFAAVSGPAGIDHEVVVTGLAPAATYEYVAASGADERGAAFGTCPAPGDRLEFMAYGDSRTYPERHRSIIERMATYPADLIFSTGDIVPEGTRAEYLDEFFYAAGDLVDHVPFLPSMGNHDDRTSFLDGLGSVFAIPPDDDGGKVPYYAVTCGNAMFISLDSNLDSRDDPDQHAFIDAAFAAARADAYVQHVFVAFHHPPYSSGNHGDSLGARASFSGYLEDPANKVTAVFTGHDHNYERIEANGLTYLVTGGAGASLRDKGSTTSGGDSILWVKDYHFVHVTLDGALAQFEVIEDGGATLDSFSVVSPVADPPTGEPPVGEPPAGELPVMQPIGIDPGGAPPVVAWPIGEDPPVDPADPGDPGAPTAGCALAPGAGGGVPAALLLVAALGLARRRLR